MSATQSPPPLTTTFTPPQSCQTSIYALDYGFNMHLGPPDASSCMPSGWSQWDSTSTAYFSPGICPSGYHAACQSAVPGSSGVTAATCCPINFNCQSLSTTAFPWYSTDHCTSEVISATEYPCLVPATTGGYSTTSCSAVSGNGFNAYGISIRWRDSDFTSSTPISTGITFAATSNTIISSSASNKSTISNSPASTSSPISTTSVAGSGSGGLSAGAKGGIAVSTIVGGLIIIAAGVMFLRWSKARKQGSKHNTKPQGDSLPSIKGKLVGYAPQSNPQEMESEPAPTHILAELEGGHNLVAPDQYR